MSNGHWCNELIERAWSELDEDEQEVFDNWLMNARGQDLYLLLRHVRRRRRPSSVKTMKAVIGEPSDE